MTNNVQLKEYYDELMDKKVGWGRKSKVIEDIAQASVGAIKSNFLVLGFLADMCTNGKLHYFSTRVNGIWCYSFVDYCKVAFGLDKSTVYAAISCYEQYCMQSDEQVFLLKPEYEGYSQSQLVEMLPLSFEQRKQINPTMTIKQIREVKKELLPKKEKTAAPSSGATVRENKLVPMPGIEKLADLKEEYSGRPENEFEQVDPIVIEAAEPALSSRLVTLTNDKQRQEWLHNYEKWGVWIDVKPLGMKYYRYDFDNSDGDHVIVMVQTVPVESYDKEGKIVIYSLVRPKGYPKVFQPGGNAQSMIVEYLREQKLAVMQF